jgi:hypothetical protein
MTRAPKLLNEDGRPAKLSLFVDAGLEPYATGILDITITGQSVVFDGPDGAHFEGTLHDLCETIRASITMAVAHREMAEAERERACASELRAEAAQTVENLQWLFRPGATVTSIRTASR